MVANYGSTVDPGTIAALGETGITVLPSQQLSKTTTTLPTDVSLNNYPNPFNPTTRIHYSVPREGIVTIRIYDVIGREVAILVNERRLAGSYSADFDGSKLPSGIYFSQMEYEGKRITSKILLIH